jgi:hypothetical protein
VSPGNGIVARERTEVDRDGVTITRIVQDSYNSCSGTYTPRIGRGALGPFTFFFAIGQAF